MQISLFRSLCLGCCLFVLNFGKAQPVITEYFAMKENVKIDLNDKKIQKSISAKGILDVAWNSSNSVLAVTYDPKLTESKEVMKNIQELFSLNNIATASHTPNTK
jgi:hypothetical protein